MSIQTLRDKPQVPLGPLAEALLPHQREGVSFLLDHPRCLLADDVGLGKTLEALGLLEVLHSRGETVQALVLTEAALVDQWLGEVRRWLPWATPLAVKPRRPGSGDWVRVTSYEMARNYDSSHLRAPVLVFDEVTALKAGGALYEPAKGLSEASARAIGMTATPLEIDPLELFRILRVVGTPDLWQEIPFRQLLDFAESFEVAPGRWADGKFRGYAPGGAEAIRGYLERHSLRRTIADTGINLPVRVGEQVRWVALTESQQARHDEAAGKWGLERYHAQKMAGRIEGGESSVVAEAVAFLASRVDREKAILWAENLAPLDLAESLMRSAGIGTVRIDGKVTDKQRIRALERFEHDPTARVLLGTRALERGLNVQHCRLLVSLDCSDNPAREAQREGRVRRIGSPHPTYEHVYFLPDTPNARERWHTLERRRSHAETIGLAGD